MRQVLSDRELQLQTRLDEAKAHSLELEKQVATLEATIKEYERLLTYAVMALIAVAVATLVILPMVLVAVAKSMMLIAFLWVLGFVIALGALYWYFPWAAQAIRWVGSFVWNNPRLSLAICLGIWLFFAYRKRSSTNQAHTAEKTIADLKSQLLQVQTELEVSREEARSHKQQLETPMRAGGGGRRAAPSPPSGGGGGRPVPSPPASDEKIGGALAMHTKEIATTPRPEHTLSETIC